MDEVIVYVNGERKVVSKLQANKLVLSRSLHREDGPALIISNGIEEYWVNGRLHREDGPAIIRDDHIAFWVNGRIHNINGPAVVFSNGNMEYWIKGIPLNPTDYQKILPWIK